MWQKLIDAITAKPKSLIVLVIAVGLAYLMATGKIPVESTLKWVSILIGM